MLTAILRFTGLTPAPKRPPSKRAAKAKGPRPTPCRTRSDDDASGAPPAPAPAAVDPRVAENRARAMAIIAREDPNARWIIAYRCIAKTGEPQAKQPEPEDLLRAMAVVGQEVAQYARALHLLGRRLPVYAEALTDLRASTAAIRADLEGRAATDFQTWDEARQVLSREQARCRRLGIEGPADLAATDRVEQGIAEMLADQAARLARRAAKAGGGQAGGVGHAGTAAVSTVPTGTKAVSDDEVEIYTPPAGPK